MIQGDVLLKGQDTDHQSLIPVMARLPDTTSEVTLEMWLSEVRLADQKGIKISFQSNDAVEITLQKLKDSRRGVINHNVITNQGGVINHRSDLKCNH
jgi:hypothetical protein